MDLSGYDRIQNSTFNNKDTMIWYKFDRLEASESLGLHETMHTLTDNGGPTFKHYGGGDARIVSIHSFVTSPNPSGPSYVWDEIGVDAWLAHPGILGWISEVAYNSRLYRTSGISSLMDPSNWHGGLLPGPSENASLILGGQTLVEGPSVGQNFTAKSLTLGGSDGDKILDHTRGGSLTLSDDVVVDTNGWVRFSYGTITANQIVLQNTAATEEYVSYWGTLEWNQDGTYPTSLTVDHIIIKSGGDFICRTASGLMNINHLDIESVENRISGRALFETDAHIRSTLTNAGVLDLGYYAIQNTLTIGEASTGGSFTQTSSGQLWITVGGGPAMWADSLTINGTAVLAGTLGVSLIDGYFPTVGEWFTFLTAQSITGAFHNLDLPEFGNLTFRIIYQTQSLTLVVVSLLLGDTNGDGMVDLADYNNVVNNLGAFGFGVLGDTNGDTAVDLADYNNVVNNLGAVSPAGPIAPEPVAGILLLLTGAGLIVRNRCRTGEDTRGFTSPARLDGKFRRLPIGGG